MVPNWSSRMGNRLGSRRSPQRWHRPTNHHRPRRGNPAPRHVRRMRTYQRHCVSLRPRTRGERALAAAVANTALAPVLDPSVHPQRRPAVGPRAALGLAIRIRPTQLTTRSVGPRSVPQCDREGDDPSRAGVCGVSGSVPRLQGSHRRCTCRSGQERASLCLLSRPWRTPSPTQGRLGGKSRDHRQRASGGDGSVGRQRQAAEKWTRDDGRGVLKAPRVHPPRSTLTANSKSGNERNRPLVMSR